MVVLALRVPVADLWILAHHYLTQILVDISLRVWVRGRGESMEM
jgi:hypothetical protein